MRIRQLVALAVELDRLLAREHLAHDLDVLARARERPAVVVAVPALHDLRARRAEPEDEPTARQVVERDRGHRHRGRRARRHLADRRAELDARRRRAPPRERRRARRSRTPPRSSTSRSRAARPPASTSGTPAGGRAPQYPIMYPSFSLRFVMIAQPTSIDRAHVTVDAQPAREAVGAGRDVRSSTASARVDPGAELDLRVLRRAARPRARKLVLDRRPVRGVVDVPDDVEVGRAQRPRARRRVVGGGAGCASRADTFRPLRARAPDLVRSRAAAPRARRARDRRAPRPRSPAMQ